MRLTFLLLIFICMLCGTAWAQPRSYPLSWDVDAMKNARTQATPPPHTNTLKIPFFYDFSSRYIQIDSISKGDTVLVTSLRPHGLKTNDHVIVSGAKDVVLEDFNGLRYVKRVSDYEFKLYKNAALDIPVSSSVKIGYLRISKLGAMETIIPDTLAFVYNQGGVQINGGSAKNQPSYYVARFDGLNEKGIPYSTTNQFAIGYTDSLTSQKFDLSTYKTTSKLYMSYYYQHGGYGEQPDANDHLYLEFLDSNYQWNMVKDLSGAVGSVDSFYIAMVPITDTIYLHDAFQYRFRSYGRQAGAYDIWNLDYIYINKNRTPADTTMWDFAIRDADQSFLPHNYTAMPFNHFFPGISSDTTYFNRILHTTVTHQANLSKNKRTEITVKHQNGDTISHYLRSQVHYPEFKALVFEDTIDAPSFITTDEPMYIDVTYGLEDGERTDPEVPTTTGKPMEAMFNNFITKRTFLYDYYAYDDSEAESGFGSNQGGLEVAMEYLCKHRDTLTHVDICFTRNKEASLENFQIFLMVWRNTLSDDSVKYQKAISIHYPSSPNGFVRYELETPVVIDSASKFYIGYLKNFPQLLTVGYDRNRDSRSNSYYKLSGTWYRMSDSGANVNDDGTMMMRPIFYKAGSGVPVGIKDPEVAQNTLLLYPNPASESIDIVATEEVSELHYTIYSLYGQTMTSGVITSADHTINVSNFGTGMYLILCTDAKGKLYSTRFIKE